MGTLLNWTCNDFMGERSFDNEPSRERVALRFDSMEEAVIFVQSFWRAMPHAEILTLPEESDTDGWSEELTAGDLTKIRKGILPADKGKWVVMVMGNNQPLTREAESWLRGKGF